MSPFGAMAALAGLERLPARDAAGDLAVVAGVGDTRRAQGHQQLAIRRELAHGVVAVVGRVDEIIIVDGQGVDALGEQSSPNERTNVPSGS